MRQYLLPGTIALALTAGFCLAIDGQLEHPFWRSTKNTTPAATATAVIATPQIPARITAAAAKNQPSTKAKEKAWNQYYQPAENCDQPATWSAQVECGNEYMRARDNFEAAWTAAITSAEKPPRPSSRSD